MEGDHPLDLEEVEEDLLEMEGEKIDKTQFESYNPYQKRCSFESVDLLRDG